MIGLFHTILSFAVLTNSLYSPFLHNTIFSNNTTSRSVPPRMISVVSSRVRMKYPAKISRHAKLLFVVLGGDFSPGEVVALALVILP